MDKDFEKQLEYCGINKWHVAGYQGQGLTIFMDDVGGNHAACTKMVVQTILPKALVLTGNIGFNYNSEEVTECNVSCLETHETLSFEEFIVKHNVRLINNSTDGGTHQKDTSKTRYLNKMKAKYNLIFTGSAGNGYGSPIDNPYYGVAMMISGCNSKKRSTYAEDEDIDFIAYTAGMSGTSFSAPFACGMAGLVVQQYPNYTQNGVYQYFKTHCEDIGQPGKDSVNGWGLLVLGEAPRIELPSTPTPKPEIQKQMVTAELSQTDVKILPSGEIRRVERLFYGNRNYFLLRDFEDVLGMIDVEYDPVNKIPVIKD